MKKHHIAIGVLLALGASSAGAGEFIKAKAADKAVENQYIVVFNDSEIDSRNTLFGFKGNEQAVQMLNDNLSQKYRAQVSRTFSSVIKGGVYRMPEHVAQKLANDPAVAYVEQDQIVSIDGTQSNPVWGLDRIDQRNLPLNNSYTYPNTASGVRAYVIDTGVYTGHSDFGGRAYNGYDFVDNDNVANDCNGHGTHVAGTIAGSTYGVAKQAKVYGVRVLDCQGSGYNSDVIAGMDWVGNNHVKPAVANLSLGGGASSSVDTAVQNLVNKGVTVVVAAGNDSSNACNYSPARATNAITVGASTSSDSRASYSNYGSCLDIFAPGSGVKSTWNNGGTNTLNGTSMASPHVAGAAALYLKDNPSASPAQVTNHLINNASTGKLSSIGSGSPNRLLYVKDDSVAVPTMNYVSSEYSGCNYYTPRFLLWWSASSSSSILEYDVDYSYNFGSWYNFYNGTSTGRMFNGQSNTPTRIRVRARNANGWSSFISTYLRTIDCSGGGPIIQ